MLVPFEELQSVMAEVLVRHGMSAARSLRCAGLFAEASRDGVASHGLNRFGRFVAMILNGSVGVNAVPQRVAAHGGLERWDGHKGPGNLNAFDSMARAIALAKEHGIGAVALSNTNHWMRGGAYGWQAADAGVVAFCWTNTLANLPPWGATVPLVGNNPLVIAVPRPDGHVVLDMAMSQFSFGALETHRVRGELLPVVGGYDSNGEMTRDPGAIEASGRVLPIGYWKGSGLALMLDVIAALLSGGLATYEIPRQPDLESGLSQVFIAIDAPPLGGVPDGGGGMRDIASRVIGELRRGAALVGEGVRYPGERALAARREALVRGVTVDDGVWREVRDLISDRVVR